MTARFAGRKGRPWRKIQAQVYAEEIVCVLCGGYVDQDMADYRNRWARSVHHLIPPDIAPGLARDRSNLRLAHLGCNSKAGRGIFAGPPSTPRTAAGHNQGLSIPGRTPRRRRPARRVQASHRHQPSSLTQRTAIQPTLVTSRLW